MVGLAVVLLAAACGPPRPPGEDGEDTTAVAAASGAATRLVGAGATFPYPIYSRWFAVYARTHPVEVNYQSIGSGGGIRQITEGTVDFGASDAPMSEEEMERAGRPLNLPSVLGAVVVTYNLPELDAQLRLDGETLAAIFLGEITRWNDPRIAALNPGVPLPDRDLLVVHRSDGSGTTYVFTDYLAAVSEEWRRRVGHGQAVRWPTGLGAKGNEAVAGQLKLIPGSIGYIEQAYARQNDMPTIAIENGAGEFVAPSTEAITRAAADVTSRLGADRDFRLSIVNTAAAGGYPIASWTYVLVPRHFEDCGHARALSDVLTWALIEGDSHARELHYAPLPDEVETLVLEELNTNVTCGVDRQPLTAT